MTDALTLHVQSIRQTFALGVAQCDALLKGLGEQVDYAADAVAPEQVSCPKCRETKYQAQAGDGVYVCGGCNANHKNGELV